MDCRERAFQLMEFADGTLRADEMRLVEEHLASCAHCRRELDSWRRLDAALRSFPVAEEPAGFTASVMGRLEPRQITPVLRDWGWAEIWLPVAASALVVPALALLVLLAGSLDASTLARWAEEAAALLAAYGQAGLPYLAMSFWVLGSGLMIAFIVFGMDRRRQRLTR